MTISIRSRGRWLDFITQSGDLEWTERADGGCDRASWRMDLPEGFTDPALTRGAIVDLMMGPLPVFTGILAEPDRTDDGWVFHVDGLAKAADATVPIDGTDLTTNPHLAVVNAIARGALPGWVYDGSLPSTNLVEPESDKRYPYLKDLLDAVAAANGKRWGVGPGGRFYYESDPTEPMWAIMPDSGVMGVADDAYYSHIFGRYVTTWSDPTDGTEPRPISWAMAAASDLPAEVRWGRRERFIDFTETATNALATSRSIANMLTQAGARMGYTSGLELAAHQITNLGGTVAHLPLIHARQMARLHGVFDQWGGLQLGASHDFVIGEVRHRAGEGSVQVFPVGLVDRDLESILSAPEPREAL